MYWLVRRFWIEIIHTYRQPQAAICSTKMRSLSDSAGWMRCLPRCDKGVAAERRTILYESVPPRMMVQQRARANLKKGNLVGKAGGERRHAFVRPELRQLPSKDCRRQAAVRQGGGGRKRRARIFGCTAIAGMVTAALFLIWIHHLLAESSWATPSISTAAKKSRAAVHVQRLALQKTSSGPHANSLQPSLLRKHDSTVVYSIIQISYNFICTSLSHTASFLVPRCLSLHTWVVAVVRVLV